MSEKKIALVVPTIRENCFRDFCDRWGKLGLFREVHLIVMEDNPQKTFDAEKVIEQHSHYTATHLCWEDIESDLKEKSWIIPRRSDTVRSYGYYYAWKNCYDYILTLDDDCYPPTVEHDGVEYGDARMFVGSHLGYLENRSRWFNTLNSVKPRGIPFYNRGTNTQVIVNHGLWTNVLDYDAPYQLANPIKEEFSYDNECVPAGLYFPMCGMNVMWKARATVLMYHLLMGQMVSHATGLKFDGPPGLHKLPFDRFGDIWAGIFMKKIADIQGALVSTGMPYIRHERASNPFANLKKEANGIEVNEDLWLMVDSFFPSSDAISFSDMYHELGDHVRDYIGTAQGSPFKEYNQYFKDLGEAMVIWADLFKYTPVKMTKGTSGV